MGSILKKDLWAKNGKYFGYPECCIKNFLSRGYKLTADQDKVHKNTGFTPCPKCSKKILEGKETLDSLIKNRICPSPFPISS